MGKSSTATALALQESRGLELAQAGEAPLARTRNFLYAQLQRHSLGFGVSLGLVATLLGVFGGMAAELLLILVLLGWLGWEARPNLYFSFGLYQRSADAARKLALGAGDSLRGDVHRLTEAAALLTTGDILGAKHALSEVDPERLPARGRFVHFLNMSALFCRLGDGHSALAMVDAAASESEIIPAGWKGLPEINRSAALCELGRFEEAAACLEELGETKLPGGAKPFYLNNLAWATALGKGPRGAALPLAQRAVALCSQDPGCQGTLGVAMLLAGVEPLAALSRLQPALQAIESRSPRGKAILLAAAAYAYRRVGDQAGLKKTELRLQEQGLREEAEEAFDAARKRFGLPAP